MVYIFFVFAIGLCKKFL